MSVPRRLSVLAGAALIAFSGAQPAFADKFSVSGKKGPFVQQFGGRKTPPPAGDPAAAADAMNQGQYQAAVLRMPQTEAKVAALLAKIEANWPYAKTPALRVHILGADYYTAYALPDGSIVVGLGLLATAESDDEVAFVLAHELGHVRLGHFHQAQARPGDGGASRLGPLFAVSSAVGGMSGAGALGQAARAASAQAEAAGDYASFLDTVVSGPHMTRSQEDESDALGFDLANAGAFAAEGASARVFDTIQADEVKRARLTEQLQGAMEAQLSKAVTDGSALRALSGGGPTLGQTIRVGGRLAAGFRRGGDEAKHRTPEERKTGIANYSVEAYPQGLALRDEQTAWLTEVRSTKEFAAAQKAVAAVSAAMGLRAEGKYNEAEVALQPALATPFAGAPLIVNERARIRDNLGDFAGADALFRKAEASADQSIDGYVDHVRLLYRNGRNEEALALIDQAVARYGNDEKPFLALMVATTKQAGMTQASDAHFRRCVGYANPSLTKDCELAAGKTAQTAKRDQAPKAPSGFGLGGLGGVAPKLGF